MAARKRILVDTGALIAAFDESDPRHEDTLQFFESQAYYLIFPEVIVVETAVYIKKGFGMQKMAAFMKDFIETDPVRALLETEDYHRASAIVRKYHDSDFDFVDACIMAMSERLNITTVATFDNDFRVFRPKHCDYLEIVP